MPSRGVLYMVWDGDGPLGRAVALMRQACPDLPVTVARLPGGSNLLCKAAMNDISPYDTTLFLDADTCVMGGVDYGFEQAEKHDIACCICEAPWANRYQSISGDVVEYNTGVIFWKKSDKTKSLFDRWKELNNTIDSSISFRKGDGTTDTMDLNDQAGFALATYQLDINPYVLPKNWNLRPIWEKNWFGPVRIWHDYTNPPASIATAGSMDYINYVGSAGPAGQD